MKKIQRKMQEAIEKTMIEAKNRKKRNAGLGGQHS